MSGFTFINIIYISLGGLFFFLFGSNRVGLYTCVYVYTWFCYLFLSNTYSFYHISQIQSAVGMLNTTNNIVYIVLSVIVLYLYKLHWGSAPTVKLWVIFVIVMLYQYNTICDMFILLDSHSGLNLSLTNGILLLHPPLLYYFYVLVLVVIFIFFELRLWFTGRVKQVYNKHHHVLYSIVYLVPLLLGSWWAEQELLWGGWWSWDFVELLSLNIFLFMLYGTHNKVVFGWTTYYIYIIFLFILTVLSVRFNIINSIHNFIPTEIQTQHTVYIIQLIFCFCICWIPSIFITINAFSIMVFTIILYCGCCILQLYFSGTFSLPIHTYMGLYESYSLVIVYTFCYMLSYFFHPPVTLLPVFYKIGFFWVDCCFFFFGWNYKRLNGHWGMFLFYTYCLHSIYIFVGGLTVVPSGILFKNNALYDIRYTLQYLSLDGYILVFSNWCIDNNTLGIFGVVFEKTIRVFSVLFESYVYNTQDSFQLYGVDCLLFAVWVGAYWAFFGIFYLFIHCRTVQYF